MPENEANFDKLFAQMGEARPPVSPLRDAAIRQECGQDLEPKSSLSRGQRIAYCAGLSLVVVCSLAVLRQDVAINQIARSALHGAAGWGLVLLAVLLLGFGPQGSKTASWRLAAALGLPAIFLAYLGVYQSSWMPFSDFFAHSAHRLSTFRCGAMSLSLGMVSAAGVLFVWRRTDPFNPQLSGALAGLVGGLSGALSIGMVCPGNEAWHLWIGHGVGVVALVLIGARVGRRLLAP